MTLNYKSNKPKKRPKGKVVTEEVKSPKRRTLHVLLEDADGKKRVRKRSSVRDVCENGDGTTTVFFDGKRNTPVKIKLSVEEFYDQQLMY